MGQAPLTQELIGSNYLRVIMWRTYDRNGGIMKTMIFIFISCWSILTIASEETLVELTPSEDKILTNIGNKAADMVSQRLMKTMLGDIKSVGLAEAARSWSKSVTIINETADSFNLGMKIKRPTYQYRNPINKPDNLDQVALDFFLSSESEGAKYFSRKVMGENGYRYLYYQPMYVTKKCLLCHSESMSDDVKAVLDEKYPNDLSRDLKLAALRAVIRVELPEASIK